MKALITLAFGFLLTCSLMASTPPTSVATQVAPATQTPVKASEPPMEEFKFPILRALGGFGLVLCLIGIGFLAVKKYAPQYFRSCSSEKTLRVIETLSMGDKRSISIIQVADSRFLVGNTAHQINLLTLLPEKLSFVSEPAAPPVEDKKENIKATKGHLKKLFEIEKIRPLQKAGNPLPEDLRTKMRQLREALERG